MFFLHALLKINLTLLLCFLIYHSLLRKLTFYHLNRAFLLGTLLLSVLTPFLKFEIERQTLPVPLALPQLGYTLSAAAAGTFPWITIITMLFWSGSLILGFRFIAQLISLLLLYPKTRLHSINGCQVRVMQDKNNPFSFFKSIFLNPDMLTTEELHTVIRHEQVHAAQWHSLDILWGEMVRVFCWFNPAAWLLMTAIRENLEFIADRAVLSGGVERKAYQYSLLHISQSKRGASEVANNFNFSHLKVRITMMNKKKSNDLNVVKYFLALPLVAGLVLSFSVSTAQQKTTQTASAKNSHLTQQKINTKEGSTAKKAIIRKNKPEERIALQAAQQKQVKKASVQSDQAQQVTVKNSAAEKPLIIIDGVISESADINLIDAEKISEVNVLKEKSTIEPYGEKGKNGVILITTKKGGQ